VTDNIPKNRDIADLEVTPFYSEQENDYEGEGGEREMSEDKAKNLDQEVLGFFKNSFLRRYERWERRDLLLIALQTMPKQVEKEKVLDNLTKLESEFAKRLRDEG
jgi:hypothetical protein